MNRLQRPTFSAFTEKQPLEPQEDTPIRFRTLAPPEAGWITLQTKYHQSMHELDGNDKVSVMDEWHIEYFEDEFDEYPLMLGRSLCTMSVATKLPAKHRQYLLLFLRRYELGLIQSSMSEKEGCPMDTCGPNVKVHL